MTESKRKEMMNKLESQAEVLEKIDLRKILVSYD